MLSDTIINKLKLDFKLVETIQITEYLNVVNLIREKFKGSINQQNLSLQHFSDYNILGYLETNQILKNDIITDPNSTKIFFILNPEKTILFLAIDFIIPELWYKIDDLKLIDEIVKFYNLPNYHSEFTCQQKFFVNSNYFSDLNNVFDFLISNNYVESLIWGSKWNSYPNLENLTKCSNIINYNKANIISLQQKLNENSLSVHSIYSKSRIKINESNQNFIIEVSYNTLSTELNVNNFLPNNMPIDVLIFLSNLPVFNYHKILANQNLSANHINLAIRLCENNDLEIVLDILKKKLSEINNVTLQKTIKQFILYITSNLEIRDITNTEQFKHFITELQQKNPNNKYQIITNLLTKQLKCPIDNKIVQETLKNCITHILQNI